MSAAADRTIPGFVNAHTHIYSGLAPLGLPQPAVPPENFVQILERIWWRLDRALDAATLRASARLYVAEALLYGTTTLVDHHESPEFIEGSLDVLADACEELGMRALLTFGATERNGGMEEARRGLAECRRFVRANQRPLVRGLVGLHASFTVSEETCREAGALAVELGTVVHVHVAEDGADVEHARAGGHAGPLERLLSCGALPPGSLMAHGVFLSPEQVRLAESRGLWLMQNPRSNEGNRVGYPPGLWASAKVALGTDGYPSDLRAESAALERLAAAHGDDPAAAARRLATGRTLVAERFAPAGPAPPPDEDEVEVANGSAGRTPRVARVTVGGRTVVRDGKLLTGDLEEIRAHAREQAARLWRRMAELP